MCLIEFGKISKKHSILHGFCGVGASKIMNKLRFGGHVGAMLGHLGAIFVLQCSCWCYVVQCLASWSVLRANLAPTWLQLGSNMAQLGLNLAPTWPNLAQLSPNLAQHGPNLDTTLSTWLQHAPTWPQLGPNLAPTWPNLAPTWPNLASIWLQLGANLPPRCSQDGP